MAVPVECSVDLCAKVLPLERLHINFILILGESTDLADSGLEVSHILFWSGYPTSSKRPHQNPKNHLQYKQSCPVVVAVVDLVVEAVKLLTAAVGLLYE